MQDPLCEYHYNQTPYHYVFNNPVRFIDPLGLDTTYYVPPIDPIDVVAPRIEPKKDTPSQWGVDMQSQYGEGKRYEDGNPWHIENVDWFFDFLDILNALFSSPGKPTNDDAEKKMIGGGTNGLDVIKPDSEIKKTTTGENTTETDNTGKTANIEQQEEVKVYIDYLKERKTPNSIGFISYTEDEGHAKKDSFTYVRKHYYSKGNHIPDSIVVSPFEF